MVRRQQGLFVKLSDLGQQTGSLTESNSANCGYGAQVGQIGLGTMEMDEDQRYLYVVNLFNNSIVKIDSDNPQVNTTQAFLIPNPSCSFNDFAVFAMKFYNNELYVGVTCTAETSKDLGRQILPCL